MLCMLPVQIVARKVYLAVPSECPVGPDGKARKAPKESVSGRTGGRRGVWLGLTELGRAGLGGP